MCRFHFESLAHDNEATDSSVSSVVTIPNDRGNQMPSPIVLEGSQRVRKFNRPTADDVRVLMAVYRVAHKHVDLVLTMNIPLRSETGVAGESQLEEAKGVFNAAVRSLVIVDYGLFA